MTLIAAYPYKDVPLLLGDFLITGGGREFPDKKAHLISPNFVVAWTGKRRSAKSVLRGLFQKFANRRVSMSDVETFLINLPQSEFPAGELHLIGWIIDTKQNCFLWNADWPHEVFYDNEYFDGSGESVYKNVLRGDVMPPLLSSNLSLIREAVHHALSRSCLLIAAEALSDDQSWRDGFGFAYEILVYADEQFRHVSDVLYAMLNYYIDENGNILKSELAPRIYKYQNFADASLVQIGTSGSKELPVHFIDSTYYSFDESKGRVSELLEKISLPLPLESNFYCLFFRFFTPHRPFPMISICVLPKSDPNIRIGEQGGIPILLVRNSYALETYHYILNRTKKRR